MELVPPTKVVIGQYRAGLIHMLFMEKVAIVLELRCEDDKTNLCYFSLASALNQDYYYQFCKDYKLAQTNINAELININNIEKHDKNLKLI